MNVDLIEHVPESVLFAKIDGGIKVQDYAPGLPCVRLIAISEKSFTSASYNNIDTGCEIYVIDVEIKLFEALLRFPFKAIWSPQERDLDESFACCEIGLEAQGWLRVKYQFAAFEAGGSYVYQGFRAGEPQWLNIRSIEWVRGDAIQPRAESANLELFDLDPDLPVNFTSFHVGQGMCGLLSNQSCGYLLDAGAGTPITRHDYRRGHFQNGRPFTNDLATKRRGLRPLSAFISHPDSDHWRLLEWDIGLLNDLTHVYLPAGTRALATSSPAIIRKIKGVASFAAISRNHRQLLFVHRSRPSVSSSNSECLVSVIKIDDSLALMAGDYIYSGMAKDANPAIAALSKARFDAVVVPHHGDLASALNVFAARQPGKSIAFFSAGNNSLYRHPRKESLDAHRAAGYKIIENNRLDNIIGIHII